MLSQPNTVRLHHGVWVIDCASRQAYNLFVIMAPWSAANPATVFHGKAALDAPIQHDALLDRPRRRLGTRLPSEGNCQHSLASRGLVVAQRHLLVRHAGRFTCRRNRSDDPATRTRPRPNGVVYRRLCSRLLLGEDVRPAHGAAAPLPA